MSEAEDKSRERELMSPGEVARAFGVHPKTVTRWALKGFLTECRTLGGHRRFMRDQVDELASHIKPKA